MHCSKPADHFILPMFHTDHILHGRVPSVVVTASGKMSAITKPRVAFAPSHTSISLNYCDPCVQGRSIHPSCEHKFESARPLGCHGQWQNPNKFPAWKDNKPQITRWTQTSHTYLR